MKKPCDIQNGSEQARFIRDFEDFLNHQSLLIPERHILLAVSGGLDSMVMMHAFLAIQAKYRLKLAVAHVNHGLRGNDSDADEMFVCQTARHSGLPFYSVKLNIEKWASERKISIEEAGRMARFDFFGELAGRLSCNLTALAHHADDRAETILMHLARGSGLRGLAGIRPFRETVIHPLLKMRRTQLENRAAQCGITYRVDHTNFTKDYRRNRIRLEVMQPLKEIYGDSVVTSICRSGDLTMEAESALQFLVDEAIGRGVLLQKNHEFILDIPDFLGYFTAIQKGVLITVIKRLDPEQLFTDFHTVERCLHVARTGRKNARIPLNHAYEAVRSGNKLIFRKAEHIASCSRIVQVGTCLPLPEFYGKLCIHRFEGSRIFKSDPNCELIDGQRLGRELTVRNWKSGDRFIPLGMKKSKKLHDFFIDMKVPGYLRKRIPVVENGKEVVWLAGYRLDERYRVKPSSKIIVQLQWIPD